LLRAPGLDGAPTAHSIARALEILAAGSLPPEAVITHEFALEAHRDAIATPRDRQAGAIKVVFRPAL
jgi:threonine dehydrogenase-like Zn-dependent dehydrogenase